MAKSLYEYASTAADEFYEDTFGGTATAETGAAWTVKNLLAQTFTIGTVGTNTAFTMEEIKLHLKRTGTIGASDVIVELRNVAGGVPTSVIAWGIMDCSAIATASFQWVGCNNLKGDSSVLASGTYAIVLNHLTASSTVKLTWNGQDGSIYAGGAAYQSKDGGSNWVTCASVGGAVAAADFEFQIYGDVFNGNLCTYSDVINKVGNGANSNATSVYIISNFVEQAESVVNVRTRKDWIAVYSTTDESVKYILNKIVSSLAAIEVINFDTSGYTSRLEAESMTQQLKGDAELLTYVLVDKNTQAFINGL
jgi:hypothetical protein